MKIYECPNCTNKISLGYDHIWSCDECDIWFSDIPPWLNYYNKNEGES